jgi:hypothetical protein
VAQADDELGSPAGYRGFRVVLPIFLDLEIPPHYIPPMLPRFLRGEVRRELFPFHESGFAAGAGSPTAASSKLGAD